MAKLTGSSVICCTRAPRSIAFQASDCASVKPSRLCQPPSWNGAATPTPTTRLRNSPRPASSLPRLDSMAGSSCCGIGKRIVQHQALAHPASEVDQQPIGASPTDLDADGKRAIRVQRQRHRRLAYPTPQRRLAHQQAVFIQPRGDQPDGLRGEPGQARQLGLGRAAVSAQRLQHHALVELAHADLVRATLAQARRGDRVGGRVDVGRIGVGK